MNKQILRKLVIEEVSGVPVGAGDVVRIVLRKSAVTALDALTEAHKRRIDKAFKRSLGNPAAFAKRVAKLRARFDGELTLVKSEFEKLVPESSAAPPQREGAVLNPTDGDLIEEDGYADEDSRRRASDRSSGKTRVSDQGHVTGSKGRNGGLSPQRQQAMERLEEQARMQKRGSETDEQAFSRFVSSDPVGREMFAEYRGSQLMDMLKACGCARLAKDEDVTSPSDGDEDDDDPYDGTPEEAMAEVEDEVKKLCEKGISLGEAWDRASTANIARFAMAKRHTVSRGDS
jgi:hypothetical protein